MVKREISYAHVKKDYTIRRGAKKPQWKTPGLFFVD